MKDKTMPWRVDEDGEILGQNGLRVYMIDHAELIVKAVNAHDDLVKACQSALNAMVLFRENLEDDEELGALAEEFEDEEKALREAIAKAGVKP